MEFSVESIREGEDERVLVTGEIDLFTAPRFREALLHSTGQRVTIDLSRATFLDSTALGVLLGAHRELQDQGRTMEIFCPHRHLLTSFKVTGLHKLLPIYAEAPSASH